MNYIESPPVSITEAEIPSEGYSGPGESSGPYYVNESDCSAQGSSYDYTLTTDTGAPMSPVGYPFSGSVPSDYAMIYRMNLDDAFLNGLNASLIESLTLNASLIGEGGAWQLLLNDNTLISGSDIGNAVESYNDGTQLKDLLRKDSTNYIYLTVKGALVTGPEVSVDCSYLKAKLGFSAQYSTTNYPIRDGNGGQVIHGVVVDSLRPRANGA